MKVCTDACILGAWFAEKIPSYSTVLDVGSGTGLLMLMLAQKNKSKIFGAEIDLGSCKQSKENISRSPWHERMKVFPGDVRTLSFPDKFDFIIANPPFFEGDLLSPINEKNIAKHSTFLTLEELVDIISRNICTSGSFGILLPYHRTGYFEELSAQNNFHLIEKLLIRQTPTRDYFRSVLHFSRNKKSKPNVYELSVLDEHGSFTSEFAELLKDYYLHI